MTKVKYYAAFSLLMTSTALTAAPAFAQAELKGNLGFIRPMSDWRIGEVASPADNLPGYCASVNRFEQGFTLALAKSKSGSFSLAVDFPFPRFTPGQEQSVTIQHSQGYHFQTTAQAVNTKSLVIQLGEENLMFAAMASEGHLKIGLPDVDFTVSLVTFAKSAEKLTDCVNRLAETPVEIEEVRAVPPQFPVEDTLTPMTDTAVLTAPMVYKETAVAPMQQLETKPELASVVSKPSVPAPEAQNVEQVAPLASVAPTIKASDIQWNETAVETIVETPAPLALNAVNRDTKDAEDLNDTDMRMVGLAGDLDAVSPQAGGATFEEFEVAQNTSFEDNIQPSPLDEALNEIDAAETANVERVETEAVVTEDIQQYAPTSAAEEIEKVQAFKEMERRRAARETTATINAPEITAAPVAPVEAEIAPVEPMQQATVDPEDDLRRQRIEALSGVSGTVEDVPIVVLQEELMKRQADLERQAQAQAQEAEYLARRRMEVEGLSSQNQLPIEPITASIPVDQNAGMSDIQAQLERLTAENEALKTRQAETARLMEGMRQSSQELELAKQSLEQNQLETDSVLQTQSDLSAKMAEQSAQLELLNKNLALKSNEVSMLQSRMNELAALEAEREAEVAAQAERLGTLNQTLETRNSEVEQLEQNLAIQEQAKAAEIARIEDMANTAVAEEKKRLEAELAIKKQEAERRLSAMEADLAQKQQAAEYKARELEAIRLQRQADSMAQPAVPSVPTAPTTSVQTVTTVETVQAPVAPVTLVAPSAPTVAPVMRPTPVQTTGRAVVSQDRFERATGFVDQLMRDYQPRAGGNADVRLHAPADYPATSLLDIEPKAGGIQSAVYAVPALNIDILKARSVDGFINENHVTSIVYNADPSIVSAAKAPAILNIKAAMSDTGLKNINFYEPVIQQGIGTQQAWTVKENGHLVKGGLAKYDHLDKAQFETHVNGFVSAFAETRCDAGGTTQNIRQISGYSYDVELICQNGSDAEAVKMLIFADADDKFTVLHHTGGMDAVELLKSINGTLIQHISSTGYEQQKSPDVQFEKMYHDTLPSNQDI